MPIYEYRCMKCGEELELMQSLNDPPPFCPNKECQDESKDSTMIRQVSLGNFVLKGSGWYKTDYARKGNKK